MRIALVLTAALLLFACPPVNEARLGPEDSGTTEDMELAETCGECLDLGGTWQPQAEECTSDCSLQDLSCYVTSCPGVCEPDACHNCFDADSIVATTRRWRISRV